ncbi:TPR-like protein [Epithele typhae]|uniref:TPR-like protein n=1 Tax=Epithele typhae TaxID=378194 RepID=UPI00200870EE|nr:TPR-like protein [Epithele typhae]KAH9946033.1 TPR-like protein [Epithele typhae]
MATVAQKEKDKVRFAPTRTTLGGPLILVQGNAAFKAGDFPTAVGHYTAAFIADPTNPTYPLNRAAAYLKLGKNEDAERDCDAVLRLDKKNVKALFRRGQARLALQRLDDARSGSSPKREVPQTLVAFMRIWETLRTQDERWDQIPATRFPVLFKTSLDASLLAALLRTVREAQEAAPDDVGSAQTAHAFMVNMPRVPRFNTVSMMMSDGEREDAQAVWDVLGRSRREGVEGDMDKRKEDGSRAAWGCR